MLAILLLRLMSASLALAAGPIAPGDVVINEFIANSTNSEWVELHNTTSAPLDIPGHYIDDITSGGGSPKAILNDIIIPAHGYYVTYFKNLLNNDGVCDSSTEIAWHNAGSFSDNEVGTATGIITETRIDTKKTPGRLRRQLAKTVFSKNYLFDGQLRKKRSATDHLPKEIDAHRRVKRFLAVQSG